MAKATPGTSVVNIKEELKKQAAAIGEKISAPSGDFINTAGKMFKFPNGAENAGPMRVVILDFIAVNRFFDRPWKEGEVTPPACIAISESPKGMIPSDKSPKKEAEACDGCPNNEFGTALQGAGKACQNTRLLAIVEPNDDPKSPVYLIKVSPTGLTSFDGYVAGVKAQYELPPIGVETDIYFDPGLKYPSLRFGNPSPNPNIAVHFDRQKAAKDRLLTLPDLSSYTAPPAKKGRK